MEILQGCESSQPVNLATCVISQVANFRNLRTLLTCVPVDYFLTRLLVVLYKFDLM